uniref:Uncharacterized protein n=1 Tax=Nelumbo nucifera TaxID=4432 RepID=A0A822YG43_NELNU|nr:TPA_asm: hypothetical protein HUJ06_010243 [Nelumbo nucifera]
MYLRWLDAAAGSVLAGDVNFELERKRDDCGRDSSEEEERTERR